MANFDPVEFEHFYSFFPEFTPTQTENVLLFSVGLSPADIAEIRHVSVGSVRKSLSEYSNVCRCIHCMHYVPWFSSDYYYRSSLHILQGSGRG